MFLPGIVCQKPNVLSFNKEQTELCSQKQVKCLVLRILRSDVQKNKVSKFSTENIQANVHLNKGLKLFAHGATKQYSKNKVFKLPEEITLILVHVYIKIGNINFTVNDTQIK